MVLSLNRNFKLNRYGLNVRLVNLDDAEFIVSLRTDEKLGKFLHSTSSDVKKQIDWIKLYLEREQEQKEFYFIYNIVDSEIEKPIGVNRIYNIKSDSFVVGSWIFSKDAPLGTAILGDIISREIGFEYLSVTKCFFDVRKNNHSVLKYHQSYSPNQINEDDDNFYFELSKDKFDFAKTKYLKLFTKK